MAEMCRMAGTNGRVRTVYEKRVIVGVGSVTDVMKCWIPLDVATPMSIMGAYRPDVAFVEVTLYSPPCIRTY